MIRIVFQFAFIIYIMVGTDFAFSQKSKLKEPIDYVDPLIGTAPSDTESAKKHSEAGSELKGQTFPVVGVPHGMTSWTPQTHATELKCLSPYYYQDKKIQGFRGSHWMSGSCTQDYGSVTIMPIGNQLKVKPEERASVFSHDKETARADYYSVHLDDYQIFSEMAGDSHSAIFRFTFENAGDHYFIIEPNSDEGEASVEINAAKKEVTGYNPVHRIYQGWGKPAGFSGHFVVQFQQPFVEVGTWNGNKIETGKNSSKGNQASTGAFVKVTAKKGQQMLVKIGMSFTNLEQARKNLQVEIPHWKFEQVQAKSRKSWNDELGKIKIKGGTEEEKVKFYTGLYHTKIIPRIFSDVDGTYTGFGDDNSIYKTSNFDYYEDFSMWDTYRAVHPLLTILEPKRSQDMVNTLVMKAEQGNWLPIFPCWNHYTSAMIGDHVIAMIGDAYIKGIDGFDVEKAYQFMRKNAFQPNTDIESYREGQGRRALESYLKYNYVPLEDSVWDSFHKREQVSRTLEYAYDDFVLGQIAKKAGKTDDYKLLHNRAKNYQHVFDTTTGYVRGKYANGSWIEPFDPFAIRASYITEGSPFQYTWYVPQDVAGLIKLMGGETKYTSQLDLLFSRGYYWHGNEPGHQIPYMYPYAGAAWKTQQIVRDLIKNEYGIGPGGLSGNEDSGQMSAWLVFSMMGFYPVTPGMPSYVLGSPVFEEVSIAVPEGKLFKIMANNNSSDNLYIQSIKLNGQPFNQSYISHAQIMNGGELVLEMGPNPNTQLKLQVPPSMDKLELR